ncbi:MAG: hypothetical protein ACPLRP_05565 [Candidatus Bipolaricaulaceae bacterium]
MELAPFLFALGDLGLAMSGAGAIVMGPTPWAVLPFGPIQLFLGYCEPVLILRVHVLRGPWFLWFELPPPRIALGRSPGHALVAALREGQTLNLAWEIMGSPWLSLFGSLGSDNALGLRFRWKEWWLSGLIRKGGLSLWFGVYF